MVKIDQTVQEKNSTGHFGAKNVSMHQPVQKILLELISRSSVTSSSPRPPSCSCSKCGKRNCTDHFGANVVKIGQQVLKIFQQLISRSSVTL